MYNIIAMVICVIGTAVLMTKVADEIFNNDMKRSAKRLVREK